MSITNRLRAFFLRMPSMKWHLETLARNAFTPDASMLELKRTHPVFICDDFMTGHRRHALLGNVEREAWCFTKQPFSMWKHKQGEHTYPIPFMERSSMVPHSVVKGELYFLPIQTIKLLDEHRANGIKFQRTRVPVIYPFRYRWTKGDKVVWTSRMQRQRISAHMYIGKKDFWDIQENWADNYSVVSQNTFIGGDARFELNQGKKYYIFKYAEYFER